MIIMNLGRHTFGSSPAAVYLADKLAAGDHVRLCRKISTFLTEYSVDLENLTKVPGKNTRHKVMKLFLDDAGQRATALFGDKFREAGIDISWLQNLLVTRFGIAKTNGDVWNRLAGAD